MAKRMNPFADDFKELNQTAEKTVLAFKSQDEEKAKELPKPKRPAKTQPIQKEQTQPQSPPSDEVKQSRKQSSPGQKKKTKKNENAARKEWGKPVTLFNTRIPPEMSELLDDLVYQLRKQGNPKTKQDLAQEAISELLEKHGII